MIPSAMGKPWADHGQRREIEDPMGSSKCLSSWTFFGADDGIRTRDPHLGKSRRGWTLANSSDVVRLVTALSIRHRTPPNGGVRAMDARWTERRRSARPGL
jgi:hypothetical protein